MEESSNWVVQNLQKALETWNDKLSEIWLLITQSPEQFKGGEIWNVITDIHGALQAIGYSLLVLFFVVGVMKTCGSFAEMKRPEIAVKMFIRFILAKASIDYGLELMMALIEIVQGIVSKIMAASGLSAVSQTVLPDSIVTAIEDCGFWESVPLWAVTLIGGGYLTVRRFTVEWTGTVYVLGSLFIIDAIANLLSAFYLGYAERKSTEELRASIIEEIRREEEERLKKERKKGKFSFSLFGKKKTKEETVSKEAEEGED